MLSNPGAQGQDAVERRLGKVRPTLNARIAKMKDGTTHLAGTKLEHAVDIDTGVVVGRADPSGRRKGADRTARFRRRRTPLGAQPRRGLCAGAERGGAVHRGRRQGLSFARNPAARSGRRPAAGRRASPNPSRPRATCVGMATRRRGKRSTPIACGWIGYRARDDAHGEKWSSARSPTSSIAAVCVEPGCADGRTSTSAT